ncbi:hypothetical protein AK830_g9865 [Neonectria ditissima]|uniref:Acetylesterase n=1 Tax=Neonectria ditissima TaxID=78410 RepID=A0A0P7B4X0_9HYPO|nr:hypothetical protein AK830_g9865 [Neonectria ditissima]
MIIFSIIAALSVALLHPVQAHGHKSEVKYLITFGDSYSKTGFHFDKVGDGATEFNPSAENPIGHPDLPGRTSAGGRNWVGFMVTEFNTTLTLSYNYALSGSTVDSTIITPRPSTAPSFVDQVGHFKQSIGSRPEFAPWTAENSVAGFWFGVNDVRVSYLFDDMPERLVLTMQSFFEQIQVLYDTGLRRFVLLSLPPINLTPKLHKQRIGDDGLYERLIFAIERWNNLMQYHVMLFQQAEPDATISIVDTSQIFWEAVRNPSRLGARDIECENKDGVSCLWFDGYHPGIKIERLVAEKVAKEIWTEN